MVEIENLKEKRLIVSRKIILNNVTPDDKGIVDVWCKIFPADQSVASDTELLEWIKQYVKENDLESCTNKLNKCRLKQEGTLKAKGIYIGYGAKLIKSQKDRLAVYAIMTKGDSYSGSYASMLQRIVDIKKQRNHR